MKIKSYGISCHECHLYLLKISKWSDFHLCRYGYIYMCTLISVVKCIYFSTRSRNFYILGENTSKYCRRIIVVHINATVFYVQPACHNIANGIKPGSNSKKTDKHAADCSKAVCWGVKLSMWDV